MLLFAFDAYREFAATLANAGLALGAFTMSRFDNGELQIHIGTAVTNESCLILGSIAPPEHQLASALLLAHTLKKEGAREVTAIFPYLAYSRHDKDKPGADLAASWTGAIAQASGIGQVITVDIHSERARQLFAIPVLSLSPAEVFAKALEQHDLANATIVAPDEGAVDRCRAVRAALGFKDAPIPYFEKHRAPEGITHTRLIGEGGRRVVIVDDILDTGSTLVSACEKLRASGAEKITIMVTHGQFTGERWKKLWEFGVSKIFCTDSLPLPAGLADPRIVMLSVAPLVARAAPLQSAVTLSRHAETDR